MDTFGLVMLTLIGALLGAMMGMAFATPFEYDKKYGKAVLTYLICIIIGSLIFTAPILIMCK